MRNVLIGISIVLALLIGVVAFLVLNINGLIKSGIETVGPDVLGVAVTVDDVDVSFMDGTGQIQGLRIANPEDYDNPHAITIDEMQIALNTDSLTSDRIHIREIIIGGPYIFYEGTLNDSNLQALQRNAAAGATTTDDQTETPSEEGPAIEIDYFQIREANLDMKLKPLERPFKLVMSNLEIENIGKDESATASDVVAQVLRALNRAVIPLIRENAGSLREQVEQQEEDLKKKADEVEGKVDELKDMFDR
ncbi:MAG: hypothetical protein HUJ31_18015 [Pseudomonadales bacterium]|nr:hypothetical protein [Pseudomonadales bacterium]